MAETALKFGRINITENDLKCLGPRQYLNDTIINFYLKYLHQTMLNEEQRKKVHIFDSFLMEALRTGNPQRISRWHQSLNIFEKNYLIIPVELNEHWYLIIVSHPANLASTNLVAIKKTEICIFDSMGPTTDTDNDVVLLKNFILDAAVARGIIASRVGVGRRFSVRHADVKIQQNLFDCGLHVLANAERFFLDSFRLPKIEHDPNEFTAFRLTQSRRKRGDLRKLIEQLALEASMLSGWAKCILN